MSYSRFLTLINCAGPHHLCIQEWTAHWNDQTYIQFDDCFRMAGRAGHHPEKSCRDQVDQIEETEKYKHQAISHIPAAWSYLLPSLSHD